MAACAESSFFFFGGEIKNKTKDKNKDKSVQENPGTRSQKHTLQVCAPKLADTRDYRIPNSPPNTRLM